MEYFVTGLATGIAPVQITPLRERIAPSIWQLVEMEGDAPVRLRLPLVCTTTLPADSKIL
jgi:hypothetical protein